MRSHHFIHPDIIERMRDDIADSLKENPVGVAMLWVGRADDEGFVHELSGAARGTPKMLPTLFPSLDCGHIVIHKHPGGDLNPSDADLRTAPNLDERGIGFLIVDDDVEEINAISTAISGRRDESLDIDELAAILEPEGELSRHLVSYEPREEQIGLLKLVCESFNTAHQLIAEAGTGVGKSLAYLLPAMKWASMHEERVLVSTATIALQQQLLDKDIPLVAQILGFHPKVALVKGRRNYLCLKRLEEASKQEELFFGKEEIHGIRSWAESSFEGSQSDLPFQASEGIWDRVCCEKDSCPGSYCPHFEDCFLMRARRKAAESSLLVANHHLLFADLAVRVDGAGPDEAAVLPAYRSIILDEAHHAEASATDLFTSSISLPALTRLFNRLLIRSARSGAGLFIRLAQQCPNLSEHFIGELAVLLEKARSMAENLDALGPRILAGEERIRLSNRPSDIVVSRLSESMKPLRTALSALNERFAEAVRLLENESSVTEIEVLAVESRQALAGLQAVLLLVDSFLHRDDFPEQVFWLELRKRPDGSRWLACHRSPLSVAPLMRELVWDSYETVISMSATLALEGDFRHWKTRMGALHIPREPLEAVFASPFDYQSQVMLGVPIDAPSPVLSIQWESFLVESISTVLELSGGHALVLFTAYETLKKTLKGVRSRLPIGTPVLLAQGEDDRGRLLKKFREHPSTVLFATDSFWEGVDVPGDALQLVLITRLPFRPPTNPVVQARCDFLAAEGRNPFMELTLPEALIRFRQGFGRLIRKSDDHGAVLVLDSRLHSKRYGSLFLGALPSSVRSLKSTEAVLRDLERFLYPSPGVIEA